MEVPRRPQPTFTMALHERTPAGLSGPGSVDEVDGTDQRDAAAGGPPRAESTATSAVSLMVEPPEPEDTNLSSQDSFSEGGSVSEETSAEEPGRNREEEEAAAAAAAERAAQRQLLAVEELVQSERNYLRMLQLCTVTIRSNLAKIQVAKLPEEPDPDDRRLMKVSVCPLQPPPADLDSLFLYIEDVMDVSGRLLSLVDQRQLGPGDPLYLQTLCETLRSF